MGENEKGIESPIELLRQLIEESGKWTEEIVTLSRHQIMLYSVLVLVIIQAMVTSFWYGFHEKGPISLPYIIVITIALIFFILVVSNAIIQLRRKYKNRVARRDRWREKFEVLKKKEEEIEKLLSEGAG